MEGPAVATEASVHARSTERRRSASPGLWIAALRARHWAHMLALPLAGYDAALAFSVNLWAVARGVLIAFCVLAFGFLLNGLEDRGMDRAAKNPLADAEAAGLGPRALVAAFAAGALLLALTASPLVVGFTAFNLILGWLYSTGPRFKVVPGVGTVSNVGLFAPLMFVGIPGSAPPPTTWALLLPFVALLLQNQLLHEAADADDDRGGGARTTFLSLGQRWCAALAWGLGTVVAACAYWHQMRRGLSPWWALHTLPYLSVFPAWLWLRGDVPAQMARARIVQRWLAAASGAVLFALAVG